MVGEMTNKTRYTVADWNNVIRIKQAEIDQLYARYGEQADKAWVGEEIDMLRSRMIYAQQMKSKLIAEILGETNATN